ncbi:lipoprotein NlpD [Halopseudomonas formosensis]|uniref:Lipoprotein NlpD n=1 Tax=Halopseudomonas formosensis TaxID=1002526 RepID=A0A1I6AU90_9GAMM|nr:lipoprotein NlpD [Halopseudomonas formosensis]
MLMALLISACAGPAGTVPVDDRSRGGYRAQQVTSGHHVVQRGDTLYSIAFRYGWDWKALAAHNGLREPYTIYPGQRLSLDTGSRSTATASRPSPAPARSAPASGTRPAAAATTPPRTGAATAPTATAATSPARTPTAAANAPAASRQQPASTPAPAATSVSGWQWPAQGQIIARFQSNGSLNKGIDIAGQLGQPVKAAANGTVVYAGRGLLGYGDMIIIKHDETYLSAYAHNSRLLVKEGEQVRTGQTIAEMGNTGTDRVKLHFEIRRRGQPVDPLGYLPKL